MLNSRSRTELIQALRTATGQVPGASAGPVLLLLDGWDRAELPAQLAHYLDRRSYLKALDWLQQENGESTDG